MPHARKLIRDGVAALLASSQTAGQRVYPSRVFSMDETDLPSISVFTGTEEVTRITLGPAPVIHRNLTVVIEGHALADERIDEALDQIALEVEQEMAGELLVDGKRLSTQLRSTEFDLSGESEAQIGLVRLTYLVPYATRETSPDTLLV